MGIGKDNKFASDKTEYSTPRSLFDPLRQEFGIETDVCASANIGLNRTMLYQRSGLALAG